MSGVEAIFGVITGGVSLISLAVQLGESAVKLKRIYGAAKSAPRNVARLVFDLETMALALQELEQHRQRKNHSGALLARCIMACQQSTAKVQQMVNQIERYMENHSSVSGKVYTAFREREVKELLDDLERAKSSLELSYMMYLAEEQRRRSQVNDNALAQQASALNDLQSQVAVVNTTTSQHLKLCPQSSAPPPQLQLVTSETYTTTVSESVLLRGYGLDTAKSSNGNDHVNGRTDFLSAKHIRRRRSKMRFQASFSLPTWLCTRVWDVAVITAQCRWSMHLRTYNIVPEDSLIFRYCECGNIAGVKRLIENGVGTPLDVSHHGWTLLDAAASGGQYEVCQYLLTQTTWPDHATVLSTALGVFSFSVGSLKKGAEKMYSLFIGAHEFDAELDDGSARHVWLSYCPRTECLDVILHNLLPDHLTRSPEKNLELVDLLGHFLHKNLWIFLKCVGLQQSDRRLPSLRSSSGKSVMHYIARGLSSIAWVRDADDRVQEWLDFGVSVLKNGADPLSITDRKNDEWTLYELGFRTVSSKGPEIWQTTPFLYCAAITYWSITGATKSTLAMILDRIRLWAKMIQQAGLNLNDYGASERSVWESLGIRDHTKFECETESRCQYTKVEQLVYGSTPAEWSLKLHHVRLVPVYEIHPPPGAFIMEQRLPTTIIWSPTEDERNEGPWKITERKTIITQSWDLRDIVSQSREPFTELVDSVQDDSGVVMLMQYRASRKRSYASRSYSQPPYTRHREVAYYSRQKSLGRIWLAAYHLCPFDSQWRFDCIREEDEKSFNQAGLCDGAETQTYNVRNCVKGNSKGRLSVQESRSWQHGSFFSSIADCQDGADVHIIHYQDPKSMRHTGTRDCPQRCSKLRLDKAQVPEPLRCFHPRRRYENLEQAEDDHDEET